MIVGGVMKLAGSERAELSARTAVTAVSEHERLQSGSECPIRVIRRLPCGATDAQDRALETDAHIGP